MKRSKRSQPETVRSECFACENGKSKRKTKIGSERLTLLKEKERRVEQKYNENVSCVGVGAAWGVSWRQSVLSQQLRRQPPEFNFYIRLSKQRRKHSNIFAVIRSIIIKKSMCR